MSTKLGVTENFVSSLYLLLIQSSTLKSVLSTVLTALATLLHVYIYIYIYINMEVYRTKYGNEQDIHYARNVTNSLCNFTEFFAQVLNL